MEFDDYLRSRDALHQTESAAGHCLHVGQVIDGMRVVAFLGRGATSEVWRVRDETKNRDYALKILTVDAAAEPHVHARFLAEAHLLDKFHDPHLASVYRICEDGDHPHFLMDVLHPLPEAPSRTQIRHLFDDVLNGLEVLHNAGVIHRDIKPSNVLTNDDGHAVLTDLGIAHIASREFAGRIQDEPALTWNAAVGTPGYGAPEQFQGRAPTPATDIHALGILLNHLFGGKPPAIWRVLILLMTSSMPAFRLRSVSSVRRCLCAFRLGKLFSGLLLVMLATLLLVHWHQPEWIELPDSAIQTLHKPPRMVITLQGGKHYFQEHLNLGPVLRWDWQRRYDTTQIVARAAIRIKGAQYERYPVLIRGNGILKCPSLTGCDIHLERGVKLITSGICPETRETATNNITQTAFTIEDDTQLTFTENANYPKSLITNLRQHRQDMQ